MLLWTGVVLVHRDPAAPISAAEGRSPHDTREHRSPVRGPRSLAAAIRKTSTEAERPFDFDRFDPIDWRPVLPPQVNDTPSTSNAKTSPAEAFFRFSALRYVVDESKKKSLLGHAALEEALLEKNQNGNCIDKFYLDNPKHELPGLTHCIRAVRNAYSRGWLPSISSDWLIDEGAAAALALLGLTPRSAGPDSTASVQIGLDDAPTDENVRYQVREVRWRRLELLNAAKLAREALLSFSVERQRVDSPGLGAPMRKIGSSAQDPVAIGGRQRLGCLVQRLAELDRQLARDDAQIRWEVRSSGLVDLIDLDGDLVFEPKLVFRRDLRRLIAQLDLGCASTELHAACIHVAECIATMAVGISWFDVAREITGSRFFEPLVGGQIEVDADVKWVTPADVDGEPDSRAESEVVDQPMQLEDIVVWLHARTDSSGNLVDFSFPVGAEAERLREALAQIWHNK